MKSVIQGVLESYVAKSAEPDGCWTWLGPVQSSGYGWGRVGNVRGLAHRLFYEEANGPIPDGLQIDHLCRNRLCVRPDHLEAVTQRTNLLRGEGVAGANARKTHCPKGHPYDEQNTYQWGNQRKCLACRRAPLKWAR